MPDTQGWCRTNQRAVISISEIYALYQKYIHGFHAAGGPRRELMKADEFSDWWSQLSEPEQNAYFNRFEVGYEQANATSRQQGIELIRRHVPPARDHK